MVTKLHPYQAEYLKDLPKNIIVAMDTGLGKGQTALAHYKKYGEGRPILVLAPAPKALPRSDDWVRELVMAFGDNVPDFEIVSYDKFARDPQRYFKDKLVLIADEVHYINNAMSKRGKAVQKLMKTSDQFIGLSATPLPNGWSSLENYAIMFGLVRNKTEFLQKYVRVDRSRGFPIILGYNHESDLKKFWNSIAKPLARAGIADLPDKLMIGESIALTPIQLREYSQIRETRMRGDEMLDSPSKLFAAMRQELTPHREDTLIKLLEGTTEHVVIFYNYIAEKEMIHRVLKKHFKDRLVWEQSGQASKLPKRSQWDSMKPSVTLAQYQSASTAIELTYATVTIYLSPTYSYAQYKQSIGRTYRNGQKHKTVFYCLQVIGTIDQAVWAALKKKQSFNEVLYYEEEVDMA